MAMPIKSPSPKTEKLYCFVDETGQDTLGKLFIVVAVVAGTEKEKIEEFLEHCEHESGRGKIKWTNTKPDRRIKYLELSLKPTWLKGRIFYRKYTDTKAYQDLTAIVITQALNLFAQSRHIKSYKATVIVDGLNERGRQKTSKILHRVGIHGKVRGLKDQSSALIRLADSIAGLIRHKSTGGKELEEIIKKMVKDNLVKNL